MKRFWFPLFTIFIVALIFWTLPFSYFQQDEWHTFGMIQSYGFEYVTSGKPLWISLLSDRVGARFIMYVLFSIFNTNAVPYGLFSLFTHLLNSFLLFIFVFKVTKNKTIGIISSAFFLINAVSDQAYSWFGTVAGSATSVTFILLSLIFYFNFLLKRKYIYNFLSLISLWISFLFKEVGYFLFVVYPILWFIYIKNKSLKLFVKDNLLLFVYGATMTVFFVQSVLFIPGVRANYITPQVSGLVKVFIHLISYPLEGIFQVFMPSSFIFGIAWLFTRLFKPSLEVDTSSFDQFYTTTMADYVSIILSVILIFFLTVIYKKYIKQMKENIKLLFLSSILVLILSFLPYIAIDKFDAYLDSRYYYSVAIGASIVVGIIFFSFINIIKNSKRRKILIAIIIVFFIYHGATLVNNLFKQFIISRERVGIISQINKIIPTLPKKTVFFVTGNSPGYYGIPELKVPFQSGFGQVLMMIYASNNSSYPMLFKDETFWKTADGGFLYDTLAQGYREINGTGFGYYYEEKVIEDALNKKIFDKNDVISLFYNADERRISDKNLDEINL